MKRDVFVGDKSDIRERVIWLIRHLAGQPTRYKYLEERFGITARKWQNVCNHAQQPSLEMVSALATANPYFVHWMITGESHTVLQLDPSDPNWFKTLISSLSPSKQIDKLEDYADRIFEETTGLSPASKNDNKGG